MTYMQYGSLTYKGFQSKLYIKLEFKIEMLILWVEEQPYWSLLRGEITGFDYLKELYEHYEDFGEMWKKCRNMLVDYFHIYDGFQMKGNQLCISRSLLREKVIRELHGGGLASHLGWQTTDVVIDIYYWPYLNRILVNLCKNVIFVKPSRDKHKI